MIRLAVAVASAEALPSAFVVWRGIEESIERAAQFGYDGVELALKTPDEVDPADVRRRLDRCGLVCPCISTGQVFAGLGLHFTTRDRAKRVQVIEIFRGMIDLAGELGDTPAMVNIGRARGFVEDGEQPVDAEKRFIEVARELGDYAADRRVTLVLEPVNRYEVNFVNSVAEAAALVEKVGSDNLALMPDVFHMNIEDASIVGELVRHIRRVGYLHLADSNRLAPGQGHTDFRAVFSALKTAGYDGWAGVEILPRPDPDTAARQAIEHLAPLRDEYNAREGSESVVSTAENPSLRGKPPASAEGQPTNTSDSPDFDALQADCRRFRREIIDAIHAAGSGHSGGSLSCVEILWTLYSQVLRVRPEQPDWPDRDRFILSKGHAAPCLYAVLAARGFLPPDALSTLRRTGSALQGHPDMRKVPGVEMSTGSLGMGISAGVGMALASRLSGRHFGVYVLVGDGELQEGQNWEALMSAHKFGLSNLVVIVDRNGVQLDGRTDKIMPLLDLPGKLREFGLDVCSCDGHDCRSVYEAVQWARATRTETTLPRAIVAHTVKGRGVSFMEGRHTWHGAKITDEHYAAARADLEDRP